MKQRQFSENDINKHSDFMLQQNLEDMKNITCTLWRHDEGGVMLILFARSGMPAKKHRK